MTAVTVEQAAKLVNVSTRTMRRWVAEGKVKSWHVSPREQYVDAESAMEHADVVVNPPRVR